MFSLGANNVSKIEKALLADMVVFYNCLMESEGSWDIRPADDFTGFKDRGVSKWHFGDLWITVLKIADSPFGGEIYNVFFNMGTEPSEGTLQDAFVVQETLTSMEFVRVRQDEELMQYFVKLWKNGFDPERDTWVM